MTKKRTMAEEKRMHRIHFFDGDKGGIGKSLAAMTMTQYYLDNQVPFIPVDSDRYNPDLSNRYKELEVRFATFSEDDRTRGRKPKENPDLLIDLAIERDIVVSLPAQVGIQFNKWLEVALAASEEVGVQLVRWFLTTGTYESLRLFKRALKQRGNDMPFVLVKNNGLADSWEEFDEDKELQTLIQQYGVKVIDFPKLESLEINIMQRQNLTFAVARENSERSGQRTRIKRFIGDAYAGFRSTGLVPNAH